MIHVFNWEYEFSTNLITYEEQMMFVTRMLGAAECEPQPQPFIFTYQSQSALRKAVMTHTLCLALLDRFMGIDQGCYFMHSCPWIHQRDVGPTPLCPDPSRDGFCHPLVHVNCDARFRYDPKTLKRFQSVCYPMLGSLRKLSGLPEFVEGHVEACACGLIYPFEIQEGAPVIWHFNFPCNMRPWPFVIAR